MDRDQGPRTELREYAALNSLSFQEAQGREARDRAGDCARKARKNAKKALEIHRTIERKGDMDTGEMSRQLSRFWRDPAPERTQTLITEEGGVKTVRKTYRGPNPPGTLRRILGTLLPRRNRTA